MVTLLCSICYIVIYQCSVFYHYGVFTLFILNAILIRCTHCAACPSLRKVRHVLVLHGQDGASLEIMKVAKWWKIFVILRVSCFLSHYTCSCLGNRNWSLPIGSFTNLHSQFHLEHIILRPCCLYILKEFELLCTQQIWYMLTGITKVRGCGCKTFLGKKHMIWIKDLPLRMI